MFLRLSSKIMLSGRLTEHWPMEKSRPTSHLMAFLIGPDLALRPSGGLGRAVEAVAARVDARPTTARQRRNPRSSFPCDLRGLCVRNSFVALRSLCSPAIMVNNSSMKSHPTAVLGALAGLAALSLPFGAWAENPALPLVTNVEFQPLAAQVERVVQAMNDLGSPLPATTLAQLRAAAGDTNGARGVEKIQRALDPQCLFAVQINPEARVKAGAGPAPRQLIEHGWREFLVKVQNEAGVTAPLRARSTNALPLHGSATPEIANRWLDLAMFDRPPLQPALGGLGLEYRIIMLYSRDAGRREAKFSFDAGPGTKDLGYRNEADILFDCLPAQPVTLRVLDEDNKPTTAAFVIRDGAGRVYPAPAKRLAPDFFFESQIYRADGEVIKLPAGVYNVDFSRGPESYTEHRVIQVEDKPQIIAFSVKRWIDPSLYGWWSGDHHIHAAGCAHYTRPTEGVLPADMLRQCEGEDLKIGCNLTWGPCFDYQKQFFCGKVDAISQYPYLLRYDVEVSGFGSHQSGHLCLLRLKEQLYPGADSDKNWPTLCLNTLRWAQQQGAVCGPAHSGWGLAVPGPEIPNTNIPPYDGIGADEYIVDVTHQLPGPDGRLKPAVDFISLADTPPVWELTMWYHTLNAGFRTRCAGETDFPCIYDERVGLGRSYVKLDGRLDFDAWCEGIRQGRSYAGDGRSHLIDFQIDGRGVGEGNGELVIDRPSTVGVTVKAAAFLPPEPQPKIHDAPGDRQPYWHLERARIGGSRRVPLEVIVNGAAVARTNIEADGVLRELAIPVQIARSSWVALRILPSSHTNPIWVLVGGKPLSPDRRSVEWCLKGVDQCWSQKERFINAAEMQQARDAYDHARQVYRSLLNQAL